MNKKIDINTSSVILGSSGKVLQQQLEACSAAFANDNYDYNKKKQAAC